MKLSFFLIFGFVFFFLGDKLEILSLQARELRTFGRSNREGPITYVPTVSHTTFDAGGFRHFPCGTRPLKRGCLEH